MCNLTQDINTKELSIIEDNNDERSHFIKKHRIFQSTKINKVFEKAVKDLKNNTRIIEPNDIISDKILPISDCYIDYKNFIFLIKLKAHTDTETVNLAIIINKKDIDKKEYSMEGIEGEVMADETTKTLRKFKK